MRFDDVAGDAGPQITRMIMDQTYRQTAMIKRKLQLFAMTQNKFHANSSLLVSVGSRFLQHPYLATMKYLQEPEQLERAELERGSLDSSAK